MDVFFLGAGRPARGHKPSSLKHIALNTKAMDWQIHSFSTIAELDNIHYIGGYHVEEVIESYPQLNFTVIPDWQQGNVVHTLLRAPFTRRPVTIAYTDTVYRNQSVRQMLSSSSEVVFGIDTQWKNRFEGRPKEDIDLAETIKLKDDKGNLQVVEFTGLVRFGERAVECLKDLREAEVGPSLIDLIDYLCQKGFSVQPYDLSGNWAEFNIPADIANFILGTKAETLARLEPLVKKSHIGKQVCFTAREWAFDSKPILKTITDNFSGEPLVVRSSSKGEDNWNSSNAGGFESILNVNGSCPVTISEAINSVIASYVNKPCGDEQVLVQKCLQNVQLSGVVFTCGLETGAPYYRINFDDKSQSTESVTSGAYNDLRTIIVSRIDTTGLAYVEPTLVPVLDAIVELEQLLGFDRLDIEFAIDYLGTVHIFQVRPITVDHSDYEVEQEVVGVALEESVQRFSASQTRPPFSFGETTLFANMPDWNPAEIIGTRPKPLASSLYRQLITNEVWAQQRAEFGYRDVRPYPLIYLFAGQPFIDVRASLNSFIPASLDDAVTERLANAYIQILADNPQFHDKIEFDVAYTIWTPGFMDSAIHRLKPYGVTDDDLDRLEWELKSLTTNALSRLQGDILPINALASRRSELQTMDLALIDKIIYLLDDCKRFGTLAFSHAARAGFVATTLLNSFVKTGLFTDERRLAFLKSFSTVAGQFEQDKHSYIQGLCSQTELIKKYGHLRPGTYEVAAQAYWEDPERYLIPESDHTYEANVAFEFSEYELGEIGKILQQMGAKHSPQELIQYLVEAIQSRESVKFEFTKSLSLALDLCVQLGEALGYSRDDVSFIEYDDLELLKLNTLSEVEFKNRLKTRKQKYAITRLIELPPLIAHSNDFYCFERHASQPNFVTVNKVEALVSFLGVKASNDIAGKIILIPQADPGYDWLFGHSIAGLITKYGGANSHMAIRAAEIGLPAAIGVGEKLYEQISTMKRVQLDCASHTIRAV